jgi:hypothetical protein
MGGDWLDTRRGNRCRVDEVIRQLKREHDATLAEPIPQEWTDLLAKLK